MDKKEKKKSLVGLKKDIPIRLKYIKIFYFIISTTLVTILPILLIYFINPRFKDLLIKRTEDRAIRVAFAMESIITSNKNIITEGYSYSYWSNLIPKLIIHFDLIKVKIFSPTGEIIYSSSHEEIGKINDNPYFNKIVTKGKIHTKVINSDLPSLEGDFYQADLVETYVPIMRKGVFTGAFEIYLDITNDLKEQKKIIFSFVLTIIITSSFILALIILLSIKLNKIENKEILRYRDELAELAYSKMTELNKTLEKLKDENSMREKLKNILRESEEKYKKLFRESAQPISIIQGGKILDINRAWLKLHGYDSSNEVIGIDVIKFVSNDDQKILENKRKASKKSIQIGLKPHFISCYHAKDVKKDGTLVEVEINSNKIKLGGKLAFLTTLRDITEEKEKEKNLHLAKQRAEEANQLKSEFLAKVSHEIRTPLNSILGFSEISLNSNNIEQCKKYSYVIIKETEHLLSIVNSILDHSKIEAGKMEIELNPFNLKSLLENIFVNSKVKTKKKNIELFLKMDKLLPSIIIGDELRLKQVIINLVENAIKFTSAGSVTIGTKVLEKKDNSILLKCFVQDTGIGIPKTKQKIIFESFSQANNKIIRKYGGTGLGVTISKELITLMNGEVGLESEEEKGTLIWFKLWLEVSEKKQLDKTDLVIIKEKKYKKNIGTILLVDDYELNQIVFKNHLELGGHNVDIVKNGFEALEICKIKKFDLILMDLQMPDMDGYTVTRRIRSENNKNINMPILALTANAYGEVYNKCIDAGMNDLIIKPVKRDILLKKINDCLEGNSPIENKIVKEIDEVKVKTNGSPIDYNLALEEFAGNKNLLDMALSQFIKDLNGQIIVLKKALKDENIEIIRQEAHKIRGGAYNLAASSLGKQAEDLENKSETGKMDVISDLLSKLIEKINVFKEFVSG